jgi:6-pyruvoyltetrahydropterin/6-carboxytetrahydropterin synthase
MEIYTTKTFEASHQLEGMGKCANLHGHTYRVEVWVDYDYGKKVFDFGLIKEIIEGLDHKHLNDIIKYPTAEGIVKYILAEIELKNPDFNLLKVRVWEGLDNYAECETIGLRKK